MLLKLKGRKSNQAIICLTHNHSYLCISVCFLPLFCGSAWNLLFFICPPHPTALLLSCSVKSDSSSSIPRVFFCPSQLLPWVFLVRSPCFTWSSLLIFPLLWSSLLSFLSQNHWNNLFDLISSSSFFSLPTPPPLTLPVFFFSLSPWWAHFQDVCDV